MEAGPGNEQGIPGGGVQVYGVGRGGRSGGRGGVWWREVGRKFRYMMKNRKEG
jgi:hypothetical protein